MQNLATLLITVKVCEFLKIDMSMPEELEISLRTLSLNSTGSPPGSRATIRMASLHCENPLSFGVRPPPPPTPVKFNSGIILNSAQTNLQLHITKFVTIKWKIKILIKIKFGF